MFIKNVGAGLVPAQIFNIQKSPHKTLAGVISLKWLLKTCLSAFQKAA
jgi:hypothetical protein